jgi:hypothetical protein
MLLGSKGIAASRRACLPKRTIVTPELLARAIHDARMRTLARPSDVAAYWDIVDELLQAQRREREKADERKKAVCDCADQCKVVD